MNTDLSLDFSKNICMDQILKIEALFKTLPQGDFPVTHYHIPGVYVRSMFIAEGNMLTGKIHNFENIAILAQGTIKISDGTKCYEISAPHVIVDEPGVKRLGVAMTDCTFITIHHYHGNPGDDVNTLVSDTFEEYEQKSLEYKKRKPCHSLPQV